MKAFFKELFEYHHHFNQLLVDQLMEQEGKYPEEVLSLFSHVINAHQIWCARIAGGQPFGVFDVHTLDQIRLIDRDSYETSMQIIDARNLDEDFPYKNTKGQEFNNRVRDILFHVVNHSTHHKAQISRILRENGITPMATDYIFYKR